MQRMHFLVAMLPALTAVALLGCGGESAGESANKQALPSGEVLRESMEKAQRGDAPAADEALGVGAGEAITSTADGLNRKIIYNAHVELVVEDFAGVPDRVVALVKRFDAYVASSDLSGSSGESRHARWTIRVPVERFEEFVNAAKGLGELVNVGTTSRDVSEEYYDVEARIRNKTKEEERLLALLEERPGKLEDVIAIERELSRVREELERMEGRMRVLSDLTSLTTVELSIREIRNYVPPQTPTLATRVRRAFAGSLTAIERAGESLLIGVVAIVPWLTVVAVGLCPAYVVVRRRRRKRDHEPADPLRQ